MPGATPDSLLALHEAGYREMAARLGAGTVLDAGCGLGFETVRLAAEGRFVVGVDREVPALREVGAHFLGRVAPVCSDAALFGLRRGSFDFVCSSHLVEHFDTPARHVSELARLLRPGGTAFFLTPNAAWDFENPFHVVLFERRDLASLLSEHFGDVWVGGLEGSERVHADFAERRARATRLLSWLDPLDLRRRVPRRWWVSAYSLALPLSYRLFARKQTGGGSGITAADYFVTEEVVDETPVLFAVARAPRRAASVTEA